MASSSQIDQIMTQFFGIQSDLGIQQPQRFSGEKSPGSSLKGSPRPYLKHVETSKFKAGKVPTLRLVTNMIICGVQV
jgi:hypothetical protein